MMQIKYVRAKHANGRTVLVRPGTIGVFTDHGNHFGDESAIVIDAPNSEIGQSYIDGATMGWDAPEAGAAQRHYAKLGDALVVPQAPPMRREVRQVQPVAATIEHEPADNLVVELAANLNAALDLLGIAQSLLDDDQRARVDAVITNGRALLKRLP